MHEYYQKNLQKICWSIFHTSVEQSGHLMILVYERQLLKMPAFLCKLMGKAFTNPKFLTKVFLKRDKQNAVNAAQNLGSFETQTQVPPEEGYDFSYHNLACPLMDFGKNTATENTCTTSATSIMSCSASSVHLSTENIPVLRATIVISN